MKFKRLDEGKCQGFLRLCLLCLCLSTLLFVPGFFGGTRTEPAQQINAGTNIGAVQVRMALPEFQPRANDDNSAKLTAVFNQVLRDDLDYSGNIALISNSFYPKGRFQDTPDIKVEDWSGPPVNAQYIAFGNTAIASGRFVVQVHVWDLNVAMNRDVFAPSGVSSDATQEGARIMAHTVADMIVDGLFGGHFGIARTHIAFQSDRTTHGAKNDIKEIWVMDYDGANQVQITDFKSLALFPSWSPDGDKLAFIGYRSKGPNVDVISSIDRRLYPFPEFGGSTLTPVWSPDGSQIAFATSKDGNGIEIYLADWNGRNLKKLTNTRGINQSPTWNPKSPQIAFVSDRSGSPQIWVMDAEGTNPQRIINGGGDAVNPSWSPDGQYIAFDWQKPGAHFDIYIHNLANGHDAQLTHDSGDNENPSWAPDGKHLVFASNRNGRYQIYTMLADGTKVRALTTAGSNQGPAWSGFPAK